MVKKVTIIVSVIILFFIFASLTFAADKNVVCTESGCSGFDGALFAETNIVPGDTVSKTFSVKNEKGENLSVKLAADPNGDTDEFSEQVFVVAYRNGSEAVFDGSLDDFFQNDIDLGNVAIGETKEYKLTLSLPGSAGNEYQNKKADFSLSLVFTGMDESETNVLSASNDNSSSSNSDGNQSPAGSVLSAANSLIGQVLGLSDTSSGYLYPIVSSLIGILLTVLGIRLLLSPKKSTEKDVV